MTKEEKNKKTGANAGLEALTLLTQLGLTMAIPIVLGAVAGHWIDGKLGTGMIFLLILLCLGIAGGIIGAYRQIMLVTKHKNR
ncbi:MAG: AtpZ/AtpI family protein [Eubacteriales bacterium]|nr:AtpZ/AtpI family protein [Eubacteriales bacterium]